ncbi:MAG: FAD-dependent oxidoreductase [Anaerolineales bacterium]|nr:FAD-dependent oxidoreductase [Anaerolineales bacterium]
MTDQFNVAVIGAGPAGMFGARELARAGARVSLFNRDIKPGGLAEYGIYLDKYTMKNGLRKQFRQALELPNLDYYGNVTVGQSGDLTLDDLRALGFQAILVAVGAQGTKWLGLPGEDLAGVYHAKDVVYHYNHLPPYSQQPFRFGKRCAVIGAGNVMLDIAHFLTREQNAEEVTAIVRRGPAEVKFEKQEMEYVIAYLDQAALEEEIRRVTPTMKTVRQDPSASHASILAALPKALPKTSDTRFQFIFLASPVQLIGENGLLTQVEIEDNILIEKDSEIKARATGVKRRLDVETVVFAIGDKVDESFGLPTEWNEFVKNPNPRFPVDGHSYETPFEDIFVGGWSRKASSGLVGVARKDGINASKAVLHYLQKMKQPGASNSEAIAAKFNSLNKPVVTKERVKMLETIELEEAKKRGVKEFKFDSNEDMLKAVGLA